MSFLKWKKKWTRVALLVIAAAAGCQSKREWVNHVDYPLCRRHIPLEYIYTISYNTGSSSATTLCNSPSSLLSIFFYFQNNLFFFLLLSFFYWWDFDKKKTLDPTLLTGDESKRGWLRGLDFFFLLPPLLFIIHFYFFPSIQTLASFFVVVVPLLKILPASPTPLLNDATPKKKTSIQKIRTWWHVAGTHCVPVNLDPIGLLLVPPSLRIE